MGMVYISHKTGYMGEAEGIRGEKS